MEVDIETDRLLLNAITPKVVMDWFETKTHNEICKILNCNDIELERYLDMYKNGASMYNTSFYFFNIIKKEDGLAMGEIGFHTWMDKHKRADIFYLLRQDVFKNKGFISEALPVILNFGFKNLNLNRIQAFIDDGNIPSKKLLLNNNFIFEGVMREDYFINDISENSDCYSLLKRDFK